MVSSKATLSPSDVCACSIFMTVMKLEMEILCSYRGIGACSPAGLAPRDCCCSILSPVMVMRGAAVRCCTVLHPTCSSVLPLPSFPLLAIIFATNSQCGFAVAHDLNEIRPLLASFWYTTKNCVQSQALLQSSTAR